jgi:hypothetical protein
MEIIFCDSVETEPGGTQPKGQKGRKKSRREGVSLISQHNT